MGMNYSYTAGEFTLIGLKELQKDFDAVCEKYPEEVNKFMRNQGTAFAASVRNKMPAHWAKGGPKPPKLAKNWRRDVSKINDLIVEVRISCKCPHWHLLENGHKKVLWGHRTTGFVEGFHYAEKTRAEWKTKFPAHAADFVIGLLASQNL